MLCRLCRTHCPTQLLAFPKPAIVSTTAILDVSTLVYHCPSCGHIQKPNFPEVEQFYDREYQISLASEEHDQLYGIVNEKPLYRTEHQADLAIQKLALEPGMTVLDYGCGKAATLAKIVDKVPGIQPAVFDISSNYQHYWDSWIPKEDQATYSLSPDWKNRFDRIMAHFVFEHVTDPIAILKEISGLLAPSGKIFISVPNVCQNTGDLLVVDHLNHFTGQTLKFIADNAGLTLESSSDEDYRGAHIVVFSKHASNAEGDTITWPDDITRIANDWGDIRAKVLDHAADHPGVDVEIYGAGFYGSWIAMLIKDHQNVVQFLDRNTHLQGTTLFDIPINDPDSLKARQTDKQTEFLYAGLNPANAKSIIEPWCMMVGRPINSVIYLKFIA